MNFIRNHQKLIGNLFIIVAIVGFVVTYAPLLTLLTPQQKVSVEDSIKFVDGIIIPKINAEAPIIYNVNPWKESEYLSALEKGVAHARGTALPGDSGTSYLFAHSSLPIWKLSRTNIPFLLLGNLSTGDTIIITRKSVVYSYEVVSQKVVWPNETEYLTKQTEGIDLILQTCTPLGTALKRLLVFAQLKR